MQILFDKRDPLKRIGLSVILLSGLTAFLLIVPGLWGNYARILVFTALLYVTMALSYDVIGGMLGYLYLGHGLFFGFGAYVTAMALQQGQPLLLALVLTACLALPAAALLSFPLFRLRGAVFALATLGLLLLGALWARAAPVKQREMASARRPAPEHATLWSPSPPPRFSPNEYSIPSHLIPTKGKERRGSRCRDCP